MNIAIRKQYDRLQNELENEQSSLSILREKLEDIRADISKKEEMIVGYTILIKDHEAKYGKPERKTTPEMN